MRIIPPPGKGPADRNTREKRGETADGAQDTEIIPNPARLARKALVMDSDYARAADPAIRRAERALEQVRNRHRAGLPDAIAQLAEHHAAWLARPSARASRQRLYRAAHDLRGFASDLGAPLIGRIAGNLSRLLGFVEQPASQLVTAHIAALRAAIRPDADPEDPVALTVAQELEERVAEAIAREPG